MKPFLNNTVETMTQGYYTLHNVVNNIVIKPITTTITCVTNIGATIINYPLHIISTPTTNLTLTDAITTQLHINNEIMDNNTNNNVLDHFDETKTKVDANTEPEQISSGNITPDELDVNALISDELDMYIKEATEKFNDDDNNIFWPVLPDL